jgi:hypothetical protein
LSESIDIYPVKINNLTVDISMTAKRFLTNCIAPAISVVTGWASISVGTSLEYGNVRENRSNIDFGDGLFAGSLYLGANTGIGPVCPGYGYTEGGVSRASTCTSSLCAMTQPFGSGR